MTQFSVRLVARLWIICLMLLTSVIIISPTLPKNSGALTYQTISRLGDQYHFFDPFIGIQFAGHRPLDEAYISQPFIDVENREQVLQLTMIDADPQIIGVYPVQPRYQWQLWQDIGQTIILIQVDYNPTRTVLSQVDVDTGYITSYLTLPDFEMNTFTLSPDGQYILLRENPHDTLVAFAPETHRLISLADASVLELDEILYAHWSPNSQYLLMGQNDEQALQATTEILTLATGERQIIDLTIARQQISIFLENPLNSASAILWSPDSETIAIYDEQSNQLHHITRDGTILHSYDVGRLFPERWSPNGRYLITTGYDDDRVGAFIIDTRTHERYQIQSETFINSSLVDFAWSPNSEYIAMFVRPTGIQQGVEFALYDRQGQQISTPDLLQSDDNRFIYRDSLSWLDS